VHLKELENVSQSTANVTILFEKTQSAHKLCFVVRYWQTSLDLLNLSMCLDILIVLIDLPYT